MSKVTNYQLAVHLAFLPSQRRLHKAISAAGGLTHKTVALARAAALQISTCIDVECVNVSKVTCDHVFTVRHAHP